jgi:cytochrome c biogenesis protein CcmG, thiol:disulfide interchange protein DsbE
MSATRAPGSTPGAARPARRGRTALVSSVVVGLLVLGLIVVLATRDPATTRAASSPLIGQPAPPISGDTIVGPATSFDIEALQGRWVLVNFFATWCVPCIQEHPELVSFSRRHAASGEAVVVSVVFDDQPGQVARFFEERGGEWPVVADPDGRVALDYGVAGIPASYLIGPEGLVRAKLIGGIRATELDALLARARDGDAGRPGAG